MYHYMAANSQQARPHHLNHYQVYKLFLFSSPTPPPTMTNHNTTAATNNNGEPHGDSLWQPQRQQAGCRSQKWRHRNHQP